MHYLVVPLLFLNLKIAQNDKNPYLRVIKELKSSYEN